MKKITIIIGSIISLVVLTAIGLTIALDPIIKKFTPQIESQIAQAVGKGIKFETASAQIFPEVGISLSGVTIVDDPEQNKIGKLLLRADLFNLLKGNVTVTELAITDASASLVKSKDGSLSIGGIKLGSDKNNTADSTQKKESPAPINNKNETAEQSLALNINLAAISNTDIKWIDHSVEPSQEISVSDINALLNNISSTGSAKIDLGASLISNSQNLKVTGTFGTKLGANALPQLDLKVTLREIDIPRLEAIAKSYSKDLSALPLAAPFAMEGIVKSGEAGLDAEFNINGAQPLKITANLLSAKQINGKATITTDNLNFTQLATALPALEKFKDSSISNIKLTSDFKLKPKLISLDLNTGQADLSGTTIKDIVLKAKLDDNNIVISPATIHGLGGTIKLSGSLAQKDSKQFAALLNAEGVDLKEVSNTALKDSKLKLEGTVKKLVAEIKGDQENLPASLSGPVSLDAEDGAIVGFNFLKEIITVIGAIPGISESMQDSIPENQKHLLDGDSTAFDDIIVRANLSDGEAKIEKIDLIHSLYIVTINGYAKFGGKLRVEVALKLTPILTASMVKKEKRLELLLDEESNLTIPAVISKEGDSTKVYPDTKELTKNAAKGALEDKAGKALDKVAPGLGKDLKKSFGGLFK